MGYFIHAQERKASASTLYFEFAKGRYYGKHWSEDAIYIHADEFDRLKLQEVFQLVPHFNYYGTSVIEQEQWRCLMEQTPRFEPETVAALQEANVWVQACFTKYKCFTILGI